MFAKPTNIAVDRCRCWCRRRCAGSGRARSKIGAVFGAVVVGLFALNVAITGDWNYQGGERKTFYSPATARLPAAFRTRTRPTRSTRSAWARVGGGSFDVLFTRDALLEVFPHNLGYFVFGRHTGFAIYFFRALMAILLFLAATRDRAMWQWLTLAAGVGTAVVLLLYMPFT